MPMLVHIPFHARFEIPMLTGVKEATTRKRPFAQPADWFVAFGKTFVIDRVTPVYLYRVAQKSYHIEGFTSERDFIDFWKFLYPKTGYQPNLVVYFHRFFMER